MKGGSDPRLPCPRCKEIWSRYYLHRALSDSGAMATSGVISVCHQRPLVLSPGPIHTDTSTPAAQRPPDFHSVSHGLDVLLLLSLHSSSVHKENSSVDGKKAAFQPSSESRKMFVPHKSLESPSYLRSSTRWVTLRQVKVYWAFPRHSIASATAHKRKNRSKAL